MWGAIAGAVMGGLGGAFNAYSSYQASKQLKGAGNDLASTLNATTAEIEQYAQDYVDSLTKLDATFDPTDMQEAFNSLYEGVIQPMERDFNENVLPGIQAAYSGGVMGASAGLSGAAQEAESNARRGLAEQKASLRFQERGQAIQRNYQEYDRRANLAGTVFKANTAAPMMKASNATTIYGANSNTIAAQLAANQAIAAIPGQAVGMGAAGLKLEDILKKG